MLYVKKITEFNEFLKIRDIWDRLLVESKIDNPYLTHDWFRIAYQYFEKKSELLILLVYEKIEVIAIAPFLTSNEKMYGVSLKKLRFLENVHTPFHDFIIAQKRRESLEAIVGFLQKNIHLWDIIELMEIRGNSENIKILDDLCEEENIFHYQFLMSRSWFVPTNMSAEQGLAKIKPKVRRELRRKIRRIERIGKLSFKTIIEFEDLEKNLITFFDFYEQTWKGKERNAGFYYKIARKFSKKKEFILYCLCLDDCPIAYTFVLKGNNTLFCIKTTYDPSYYAFSAGTIMFHKILENSYHSRNVERFDVGRGEEYYKQELKSYPINQIIYLGGHKRSFASYLYYFRFRLVLHIKNKRLSMKILTFLKYFCFLIKKVPELTNEIKKIFKKKKQVIVYHKKLSFVKNDNNDNGWFCGKADSGDIEHLAVAMQAKNFSNIKKRLKNEKCLLIKKDKKIRNYFWFAQNNREVKVAQTNKNCAVLTEFDPFVFKIKNSLRLRVFNSISNELIKQKYDGILTFSKSIDNQRNELFESLGFHKLK